MRYIHWLCIVIVGAVLTGCVSVASPSKESRLPKTEDLIGTWVGITDNNLYSVGLQLGPSGRGKFAVTFLEQSPRVASVQSWSLSKRELKTVLSNETASKERTRIHGVVRGDMIWLVIEREDWTEKVILRKAPTLERRLKVSEKAVAKS
jgi:hypothetical protein